MVEVYFNAHAFGFDIARLYCDRTFLQAEGESVCFVAAVACLSRAFVQVALRPDRGRSRCCFFDRLTPLACRGAAG